MPTEGHDGVGEAPVSRRRARQVVRRPRRVEFSLSEEEYARVRAAARDAGLANGAYAGRATLAAVQSAAVPAESPLRDALAELIRASGLVRRIGVNLNQAVAKLNATGQRSGDLVPYAAEALRRAERLDCAAEHLRRALR